MRIRRVDMRVLVWRQYTQLPLPIWTTLAKHSERSLYTHLSRHGYLEYQTYRITYTYHRNDLTILIMMIRRTIELPLVRTKV